MTSDLATFVKSFTNSYSDNDKQTILTFDRYIT